MYRSVKITEKAYKEAKKMASEMSKNAPSRLGISHIIEYALRLEAERMERRRKIEAAAGGWADMDCDALIKDIYEGRKLSTRPEIRL